MEITPSQGEISVGESKFFLCEGKNDRENVNVSLNIMNLLLVEDNAVLKNTRMQ